MLKIVASNQFKKDIKVAIKRGYDIGELDLVIDTLVHENSLDKKYKQHELKGNFKGFMECHIKPNWLLIYKIENKELELFLFRTGTHSDLFK